ncbi:MAG: PhzF family phenazine biosynthesis protein [Pseudomonadota bacterium]
MSRVLSMFQVDAFTDKLFAGNPAAVLILDAPLEDALMQAIASENNLSETAFAVKEGDSYRLRWFTPAHEAAFCGHATLATAHVLLSELEQPGPLSFFTQVGPLSVARGEAGYAMSLPGYPPQRFETEPDWVLPLFGRPVVDVFCNFENMFAVLQDEAAVRGFVPDLTALAETWNIDLCVTAKGNEVDFVSRYFAPRAGIPEDPVTGSTHATLVPYWAARLDKRLLTARQCSARGGELMSELEGDRVVLYGRAVTYLRGEISVPPRP